MYNIFLLSYENIDSMEKLKGVCSVRHAIKLSQGDNLKDYTRSQSCNRGNNFINK